MTKLEYLNERIDFFKQVIEEDKEIMSQEYINEIKEKLALSEQIKTELEALEILKSKLYLPEENDCDTLDDGSKVYMIYAKGVWSEEEYKALKEVFGNE